MFSDGTDVEFLDSLPGAGDSEGFTFFVRSVGRDLIKLIWEVAKACDMVILATMEDFVPILTSAD
jgi:hypothetical protein